MRQQLQNIAENPQPIRRVGIVREKNGVNARVEDVFGRTWIAELNRDANIRIGDTVVVTNGVVVSTTYAQPEPTIFEV